MRRRWRRRRKRHAARQFRRRHAAHEFADFDEWGEPISATGVAGFPGPVAIYVGTPSGKDSSGNDLVTSYSLSTAAPGSIPLAHHEAIWIVAGTPPAGGLPKVRFVIVN